MALTAGVRHRKPRINTSSQDHLDLTKHTGCGGSRLPFLFKGQHTAVLDRFRIQYRTQNIHEP